MNSPPSLKVQVIQHLHAAAVDLLHVIEGKYEPR
jgi:hypothetical protein